jgi:hypothetical protein
MVVKSATKKRLMDMGFPESWAHTIADDRKWDGVIELWPIQIKNAVISNKIVDDEYGLNIEVMEKWLLLNCLITQTTKILASTSKTYLSMLKA